MSSPPVAKRARLELNDIDAENTVFDQAEQLQVELEQVCACSGSMLVGVNSNGGVCHAGKSCNRAEKAMFDQPCITTHCSIRSCHASPQLNDEASEKILEVEREYNRKRRPKYVARGQLLHTVPNFWQRALSNSAIISSLMTEDDTKALAYLDEVC